MILLLLLIIDDDAQRRGTVINTYSIHPIDIASLSLPSMLTPSSKMTTKRVTQGTYSLCQWKTSRSKVRIQWQAGQVLG